MGAFQRATGLDSSQARQEFGRFQFLDRALAQPGEQVGFQAAQHSAGVFGRPAGRKLLIPLAGQDLETPLARQRGLGGCLLYTSNLKKPRKACMNYSPIR